MSDPGFREIHLSGKHVVFLFMAGAVAAVAVFLLGVSVGKGITKADAASAQATPPISTPADPSPAVVSDSSKPDRGELRAIPAMQGKDAPKPDATPAATPGSIPAESPSPQPKASTTPTPTPAKAAETKPDPAPSAGGYFVLVDSFSSRTNANNQRAELKKKGFNANVFTVTGSKAPYRVRIGPYDDKSEADAMAARLRKEGYKPSVIR